MVLEPLAIFFHSTELIGLPQSKLRREALDDRLQKRVRDLVSSENDGRLKQSSELDPFDGDCSRPYGQHLSDYVCENQIFALGVFWKDCR
jgi:hypothetical protein